MLTSYYSENQSPIKNLNKLFQIPKSYSEGKIEVKNWLEATHPGNGKCYRGWAVKHREYMCLLKGVTLPEEF